MTQPAPTLKIATLAGGPARYAIATLAGGCFWCPEAIFNRLKGVESVESGYCGGNVPNPTYEQVCSGSTGHAESVQIKFDPNIISYEKLLEIFFRLHDSTTLNRQGNDVGTQYRSAIFYQTQEQRETAQKVKNKVKGSTTEIVPFTNFYPAENYHRNYYDKNRTLPLDPQSEGRGPHAEGPEGTRRAEGPVLYRRGTVYCQVVIDPKIQKLSREFAKEVKEA